MTVTKKANCDNDTVELFSLSREKGELILKKNSITVDDAVLQVLVNGLSLICDQKRYSDDGFRRYTEKWRI